MIERTTPISNPEEHPDYDPNIAYIFAVDAAVEAGKLPPPPQTRGELRAVLQARPEVALQFLPAPAELPACGIDRYEVEDVEPLNELFQQRFLRTLHDDAEFRAAVLSLLKGGAAG